MIKLLKNTDIVAVVLIALILSISAVSAAEYLGPATLQPQLSSDGNSLYHAAPPVIYVVDPNPPAERVRIPARFDLLSLPESATATFSITYVASGGTDLWGASCTTFPEQAKPALERAAAAIWGNILQSSVTIAIRACWSNLGSATILGYSGGAPLQKDFVGAPRANTWYNGSLANALAGRDLDPAEFDMHITYNSNFSWYYGTDGNPPSTQHDLMTVVLHEIAHGLNFSGSMAYSGGTGSWGYGTAYPYIYDTFMRDGSGIQLIDTGVYGNSSTTLGSALTSNNIWFHGSNAMAANGGQRVKMYAPPTWASGSSYSHMDYDTFYGTANALMVYAIPSGTAIHDPGPIAEGILKDLGWAFSTYALSPTSASFSSSGNTGTVAVTTSSSGSSWTATSNAPWITVTSGSSGTGSGTVSYSIAANTTGSNRTGTITIGGQIFTITQTGLTPLYFLHVATNFSWKTEIAIINTSPDQITGTLRALSNEGQLIETKDITLSARGRRQITIADEFTNHTNIGYIVFDADSAAVQGYTKFYVEGIYRAAIPAVKKANTTEIYIPHIASNDKWWTAISLVNTTSSPKQLTITFNNGQSVPYPLNANQHWAFDIASLFNNQPQPDIQSAVITNASGVVGLELFGSNVGGNQMDGILLTGATASTIYYPHVASDNIWWTGIGCYNPSESACTITITPYSAQGTPLSPSTLSIAGKGKYIGIVSDLGLPAQTAWFRIDSTRPLSGFELFGTLDGKQLAAYAGGGGIGAREGVFAKIEKSGGWTSIAFINTEDSAASVTLTAYNDNGTAVATQALTIGGYAKVVNFAEATFSPQNISGATYIAYSSDRNVVGFQLNGSADGMMLDGLPVLDTEPSPGTGMVLIPAGSFQMGDAISGPVHTVTVSAFYLDKYEVTKALWDEVYAWAMTHGYRFNAGAGTAANHPVQNVSWYDVVKWLNARSEKEGRRPVYYTDAGQATVYRTGQLDVASGAVKWTANGYRLTTEAEWEYAARGGTTTRFYTGNCISTGQANYNGNYPWTGCSRGVYRGGTTAVGSFVANTWGLYDMAGNVWEWTWDRLGAYSSVAVTNPKGPDSGSIRVNRGGSWYVNAYDLWSANRYGNTPSYGDGTLGFRSALSQQ